MGIVSCESIRSGLEEDALRQVVQKTIGEFSRTKKVLLIHPDYSRHDFTEIIAPQIYQALESNDLERLDTLNAAGTHRAMSEQELVTKLGLNKDQFPKIGSMYNHEFDNPSKLVHVADIAAQFVRDKTDGHLDEPLAITANKIIFEDYDLIVTISGTVPHEGTGYSGGTKILFPGISGPEVTGLFHWAAVLIGVPEIIGKLQNPAREVVNAGAECIFNKLGSTPIVSFNMVYIENDQHQVVPRGLYTAVGLAGFAEALSAAAHLSSQIHIRYLDRAKQLVVQRLPKMYDEVWTAGKGSYKLQKSGVIADGGEIILLAPHIDCFHSNKTMDREIREIGYHGRDWVLDYCRRYPGFNKNVASHVINLRGLGKMENGTERFPFKVTLATQIPSEDCQAVGLGYRDPSGLRKEDFSDPDSLWIPDGGQWLYARASN